MEQDKAKLVVSAPATYRICIQGYLEQKLSEYLQGMIISIHYDESQHPISSLTGQLLDQAALMGVLNALYDRHLPILSVECLSKNSIVQR